MVMVPNDMRLTLDAVNMVNAKRIELKVKNEFIKRKVKEIMKEFHQQQPRVVYYHRVSRATGQVHKHAQHCDSP